MRKFFVFLSAFFLNFTYVAFGEGQSLVFSQPQYVGSGCPKDSLGFLATNDAFTLTFANYIAEKGPSISNRLNFRNCHIRIIVTVPSGYTAIVESIDYRGYTSLQSRTYSLISSFFTFGSFQVGSSKPQLFRGEGEFDFLKRDIPYLNRKPKCSSPNPVRLDIYNSLMVWGERNKSGMMTIDSLDGVVQANLQLTPCR